MATTASSSIWPEAMTHLAAECTDTAPVAITGEEYSGTKLPWI